MDSSSWLRIKIGKYRSQLFISVIFLALWALFYLINPRAFSAPYTYTSLMSTLPFIIIPALGLTYIMICAEIDLSFPSIMGLSAWLFSSIWSLTGSTILGLFSGLLGGLLAGLLNGVLVVKARIPSLILTIGTMFLWRGVVMVGSQGFGKSLLGIRGATLYKVLVGRTGGIPAQMLWAVALALIFWLILGRHKFGAHVYFTGDSLQSARLMGLNTDGVRTIVFMIMGVSAAFAGILVSLELLSFWPGIGEGYLLLAIASVVIGGTSVFGGSGSIFGTFVGAHIIGWLETGILAGGISGFWTQLVVGLVIVVALVVQMYLTKYQPS
jgi:simple sugar transport system permease protein